MNLVETPFIIKVIFSDYIYQVLSVSLKCHDVVNIFENLYLFDTTLT